ncbi:MAG: MFS transporter [Burkholderiales bacterium]|nr:MFS transporter [Burkholderiales bacterium]
MTSSIDPPPLPVRMLVALCVLNHVALSGARLALVEQGLHAGVHSLALGLMFAPFALASTLGALPLGRWVDRIGARRPALGGMAATTLALLAAALWPAPAVLAAMAAAVGLGYTASLIALQAEIARGRDERTRRAGFSAFATGTAASSGFGPFLAGQLMSHAGAGATFGVLAAVSLAALAGAAARAARLPCVGGATTTREARPPHASLRGLGGLRRLLVADLGMALAWNANGFVVPIVVHANGWPADVAGNLLGCFGAAVLLVRALPHAWRAPGSDWGAITRALLASGAVLALLPLLRSMGAHTLLQALLGCGLGSSLPSVMALVEARTPDGRRAEVLGLRQAVLGFGAATTPTAVGALVSAAGAVPALAALGGGLLLLGAAIAPRNPRKAPQVLS